MDKPAPKSKLRPTRRVYKPTKPGGVMQPGTVDWELNRRHDMKEERQAKLHFAELEATRHERERETHSIWWSFFRIFRRYWPE
jgi:hypothetical protein